MVWLGNFWECIVIVRSVILVEKSEFVDVDVEVEFGLGRFGSL